MTQPPDRELFVFSAARRLPAREQGAYLDEACASDAALRERVEQLLEAGEEAGAFLEDPAHGAERRAEDAGPPNPRATLRISATPAEKAGDRIGRYKLLQQIGEGGCGVVYMAEQEEPVRRRVALKVIKLGMDTKSVIARFEAERQALAMMDHPSIARVLDAGATDTGRPYFVMELVRGTKITEFCDQKQLPTRERLDLFVQVCQAIQHAHQKGIIHRDIKPSNILVTQRDGVAVPKVIDFGIAKATTDQRLTDKTLFTQFELFIGTPAYMSPEQAEMSELGIDTRSDIYSLGILLYELLTGTTPFDARELMKAGLVEIRRIIREEEPARPSTRLSTMLEGELTTTAEHRHTDAPKLIHLLRGDLDWVVMKALEKDRARRYETANGLAMDIQRHLENEPVVARPPSTGYRFQKLVRRNKLAVAAGAAIATALVLGMVGSAWQAARAKRAERQQSLLRQQAEASQKKSETEAAKATAISDFLQQMLSSANPDSLKGSEYTVRHLLDDFSSALENQFKDQPEVEAEVRSTLARAYYRLGLADKSQPQLERALSLRRRLFGMDERVAATLVDCAWTSFEENDFAKGESQARDALKIYRERGTTGQPIIAAFVPLQRSLISQSRDADVEAVTEEASIIARKSQSGEFPELASMIHGLAELRNGQSRYAEAEALASKAVAMHRRLRRAGDIETAWALVALGKALKGEQKLDAAEHPLREALAIFRKQYASGHKSLDTAMDELRLTLEAKKDFAGLVALYQNTLVHQRATLGNNNPAVPETLMNLAGALQQQGKHADAEKALADALDITSSPNVELTARVPALLRQQAQALDERGKSREAEKLFEGAIAAVHQKLGETNLVLGELLHYYGDFLEHENKIEAALDYHLKSLPIRRAQPDDNLVWGLRNAADELTWIGRQPEAEGYYREALAVYRKLHQQEDVNGTAWISKELGDALYQQHKLPEAEQACRDALAAYRKCNSLDSEDCARAVGSLLDVLKAENKPADGEALCREILARQRAAFTNDNRVVAQTLIALVDNLTSQGKQPEAERMAREAAQKCHAAMAPYEKLASDPNRHQESWSFAISYEALGALLKQSGQTQEAENAYRDTQLLWRKLLADFNTEDYRFHLAVNCDALANLLRETGRTTESLETYRNAQAIWFKLVAEFNLEDRRMHLGCTDEDIGQLLKEAGRFDEATETYRQALAVWRKLVAEFNKDFYREHLSGTLVRLATTLQTQGKLAEAKSMYVEAAEHGNASDLNALAWPLATGPDRKSRDATNAVLFAEKAVAATLRKNVSYLDTLAAAYSEAGQFEKAVSVQQEAIACSQSQPEKQDLTSRLKLYENNLPYRDAGALAQLTMARLTEGRFTQAEALARECLTIREQQIPDDWRTFNTRAMLGASLSGQKKYADAEPFLLSGYEGMKQRELSIPQEAKPRLREALQRLVQLYEATGHPEQAARWKQKLAEPDQSVK